ncbi:hypothetical protein [Actinoplanes sp. DH11]|uniref:hypothetical protein n=1 Tax=Actinoplanes sp. DH11 TaxID=2857011 RepID=UPI001E351D2C|nr:hypothetical protein [Actinoplanes sp. DH11]
MINGDVGGEGLRRRLVVGVVVLTAAAALTGCGSAEETVSAPAGRTAAPKHFGPAGYGNLTLTMTEAEALATGDLHSAPASMVQDLTVYSFVDGPKPDPSRMAAEEKLAKELEAAEKKAASGSIDEQTRVLQLRAKSMRGMATQLDAFLGAGGAGFTDGKIDSIAAPVDAATEAGIKRGSTLAELKAAYQAKGLEADSESMYLLAVEGNPGWVLQFETENDAVKYMTLNNRGK